MLCVVQIQNAEMVPLSRLSLIIRSSWNGSILSKDNGKQGAMKEQFSNVTDITVCNLHVSQTQQENART